MKLSQKNISLLVLTIVIGFSILCAFQMKNLKFDYDFEAFFPNEDNELEVYETHRKRFEWDNEFVLVAFENNAGIFKDPSCMLVGLLLIEYALDELVKLLRFALLSPVTTTC